MQDSINDPKVRVAVVGGGCAGLAAAWELAKLDGYDVHLYERSWRLGGKGASGRDEQGRIREHGLHIWLGFYENAFRMMRECYAEAQREGWGPWEDDPKRRLPHGSIDDAFFPEPHIGVATRNHADAWEVWSGHLPPMKGRPGDPIDPQSNPFTLPSYIARCLHLLNTLMVSIIGTPGGDIPGTPRPEDRSASDEAIELDFSHDAARSPRVLVERMARMLRGGALTTAAGLLQGVTIFEVWMRKLTMGQAFPDTVIEFVEALAAQTRKLLTDVVSVDERIRRKTEIIDIVMTIAVGLFRDRVLLDSRGLDAINDIDYRDWLSKHGATRTAVASPFITGIYDLVFAYRDGDHERPALAAGVALRGALRMFLTYRGAMFYRMRSGMGETIFSPLYKALGRPSDLIKSPVTFHFQHALERVELDLEADGGPRVTRLTLTTAGDPSRLDAIGATGALDHFGCWPEDDRLFAEARQETASERLSLVADEDFDVAIFAMAVDDFVHVCGGDAAATGAGAQPTEGLFALRQWRSMRKHVRSTGTKAAQVWMDKDLEGMGWFRGPTVISAMGAPFATWADMTYTLAGEQAWRDALAKDRGEELLRDPSQSVAAFCTVLGDQEAEDAQSEQGGLDRMIERDLHDWLSTGMRPFWPLLYDGAQGTALDHLVSLKQGASTDLSAQHLQVNYAGSERYTLSLPGSIEYRISPLDRSVVNMTIAGDWTACGIDAGCVEAAVMSGLLAAHAVTGGTPSLDKIVGYNHP